MDTATTRFQRARPYTVLPFSPNLAALYTCNSATKDPVWCRKCGSYLLNGAAQIRVIRLKHNSKALRAACTSCSWDNNIPFTQDQCLAPSAPSLPAPSPAASTSTSQNSRVKKKSDLQALLARNRRKEENKQINSQASGGLAAFLSGL